MNSPEVIKESRDWMVVCKPAGWHTVALKKFPQHHSLESWLKEKCPKLSDLPEAGVLQRLDEATSGAVFVAKTKEAFENWKPRFRSSSKENSIQKIYLAVVEGRLADGNFRLYFHSRYRSSKKIQVRTQGELHERGECRWQVIASDGKYSFLQIELIGAGKRHQIRAGFASLGHPLAGDLLYDAEKKSEWTALALHSWKINCPGAGEIACALPKDWPIRVSWRKMMDLSAQELSS